MTKGNDKNALLEPLKIALSMEMEGKQLFLNAAAETKSSLAKQTFEFLAKEEDRHIAHIQDFYKSLEDSHIDDAIDTEISTADQRLETFNLRLEEIKDEFKPSLTDVEAYQIALKFENGAEEFYEVKYREASHPKVKKFYKWLIDEESMHSRLINSCLKFVEDPAAWFQSRKSGQ